MKTIFKISLFVTILIGAYAFQAQKPLAVETIVIKTNIYCSHCQKCESCGGLFEEKLKAEKGIKSFVLDEKAMTITVEYDSKRTTPAKIKQAISKLGYDADDVKADATAYEKLDGCCKKR